MLTIGIVEADLSRPPIVNNLKENFGQKILFDCLQEYKKIPEKYVYK